MASDTLAELLGFDPGTPRPNAYQLFGLKDGEKDSKVITAAINRTLRRLKASQQNCDPNAWKQAAAAVTKARKILTDADAKAAYDAKRLRQPRGEAIDDPLRGLLPQYDPLAAFDMTAAAERITAARPPQPTASETIAPPRAGPPHTAAPQSSPPPAVETGAAVTATTTNAGDAVQVPEPLLQPLLSTAVDSSPAAIPPLDLGDSDRRFTGASDSDMSVSGAGVSIAGTPPVGTPTTRRRRRRKFPWATTVLTVMVVAMLCGIGFGIRLLMDREQQTADGGERTTTAPAEMPELPQTPVDPVMGALVPENDTTAGNFLSSDELERNRDPSAKNPPESPGPTEEPASDVPMTESTTEPEPKEAPSPEQPSMAARQAGQAAIDATRHAILQNNWAEMKPLAAQAVQAAADDEQKTLAQRLFQVADLADYYYRGLMQSLEKLEAGDQIELENIGIVGVVEANETTFAIQVNARPKSFEFDKIPFFVLDAIARLSMDLSDPTTRAAKAVHQAISVNATPEHRRQSLDWIAELPVTLQDADTNALQEAIRELYPNL